MSTDTQIVGCFTAIALGLAPTAYVPGYNFLIVYGGQYTGTLASMYDIPGYMLTTGFFQWFATMMATGGWPLVFKAYASMVVGSGLLVLIFIGLEKRAPTTTSPWPTTNTAGGKAKTA